MIHQTPVHERLKDNAMKFDNLLRELDGMKFMDLKSKELYEISGYQISLLNDIRLELYNPHSEFEVDVFLYVTLEDPLVETAIAAVYEQGLVPVVTVAAQEEAEDDETESYEEDCGCPADCPICAAEKRQQEEEAVEGLDDILELLSILVRGK